eukprot:5481582-Pleurochrysis_carterae.AAC.3
MHLLDQYVFEKHLLASPPWRSQVQLAVSPPDRQHMMGPPVQERLGECAQCKAYGRGVVDKCARTRGGGGG